LSCRTPWLEELGLEELGLEELGLEELGLEELGLEELPDARDLNSLEFAWCSNAEKPRRLAGTSPCVAVRARGPAGQLARW